MTVLTFPPITPASASFGQLSNTQAFVSDLDGTTQTIEMPGARWHLRMLFEGLANAERRDMAVFLAQCRGMGGRFYYGDPAYLITGPAGGAPGTPLVKGGSQTGTSLDTDGWGLSQADVVKKGDYIHFDNADGGREMKMITAGASSDGNGTGEATLSFEPATRIAPADNAAITVTNAMAKFRLVADNVARWNLKKGVLGGSGSIEIQAVESFTDAA